MLKFHSDEPVKKFIDLDKLIADKNPGLAKWLPGFIKSYLKRVIHQEDLNIFLTKHEEAKGYDFCKAATDTFEIDLQVHGLENVPTEGGCIFSSNHPLGGMDAMLLVTGLTGFRDDIRFVVNDILLNLTNLDGLFVGVNKHGKNATRSLQKVDELFGSDKAVFLFPAGLVSRKIGGKIEDLEWKKTFITRSKKYNTPVVPVYISGGLSSFFYRLANLRMALGIKANIEMLYLINELFKQHKESIHIVFGPAVSPEHFDKSKTDREWAAWMREQTYQLEQTLGGVNI